MANNTTHFIGCTAKAAQPTQSHRPALWENMLGTVYALNADGECRYFDYDWDAARAWAGVDRADADLRVARVSRRTARAYVRNGLDYANPRVGQLVLWVRRANTPKLG